jgi:hypothetical protein
MTSPTRNTKQDLVVEKGKAAAQEAAPPKREKLIDAALDESFPASDPPSYMGGAVTGGPRTHKP